jgi:hypothetical protein
MLFFALLIWGFILFKFFEVLKDFFLYKYRRIEILRHLGFTLAVCTEGAILLSFLLQNDVKNFIENLTIYFALPFAVSFMILAGNMNGALSMVTHHGWGFLLLFCVVWYFTGQLIQKEEDKKAEKFAEKFVDDLEKQGIIKKTKHIIDTLMKVKINSQMIILISG